MEPFSFASLCVDRMLVDYFRTPATDRDNLLGADQAKKAWKLIRNELEIYQKTELADAFQEHPVENRQTMTAKLAHLMKKNRELEKKLSFILDQYLQEMYSGKIDVSQEIGEISNASGVIKGGTVTGVRFGALSESEDSED